MANDEYKSCMTKQMQGFPKGISREERGDLFCIAAKLCSGKAKNESEAKEICANRVRSERTTGRSRKMVLDAAAIAQCMMPLLANNNRVSQKELASYLQECSNKVRGRNQIKIHKPETKSHFLKVCGMQAITEQGLKGTMAEIVRVRKQCEVKWNEKENGAEAENVQA